MKKPKTRPPAASDTLRAVAAEVEARLQKHKIHFTLGGEPTYVPDAPEGSEWSITALGPTKLRYAYALADVLIREHLPQALSIYSPGKHYPGEANPRWAINLVWPNNGTPLLPALPASTPVTAKKAQAVCASLLASLKVEGKWLRAMDRLDPRRQAWVLPLDHDGRDFLTEDWKIGARFDLISVEGPAGLRLPLQLVPPTSSRRALTMELIEGKLQVFLPPLLQKPWRALLKALAAALRDAGCGAPVVSGYVPPDQEDLWSRMAIVADPGVLEINLPPCPTWEEYADWLDRLEKTASSVGLRSYKQHLSDEQAGTGGGNHLLFGGPSPEQNAFFTQPRWLVAILRYWQRHPALAYLFTGHYVGSASQAPRPDESASALYDLEMAYQLLEDLPPGQDHRGLIGETLRHLHTDATGNTHRSEISFDKFWSGAFDGGCRGLIEFRALETLPKSSWMSTVALLWRALAVMLLDRPKQPALIDFGSELHDRYFLPSVLWADLRAVLADLRKAGLPLPEETFRAIYEWRFPQMLEYQSAGARLEIRKALEPWPLLCETPLEGGNTSRFVDTSIERVEFHGNPAFIKAHRVFVQGREFTLSATPLGLRYRRTALYPSLHPGIKPHMPLTVTITDRSGKSVHSFQLTEEARHFTPCGPTPPTPKSAPCRRLKKELVTCDLRIA